MRRVVRLSVISGMCSLFLLAVPVCHAAEWTTLRGRIVFSGELPEAEALEVTRDEDYCGPFGLKDESLIVNPENRGLKNVAIWLRTKKAIPVHPSYKEAAKNPVILDNHECRFAPRMLTLRTQQTLRATNTDTVPHNLAVYARRNDPFSEIVPQRQSLEKVFARPESVPIRVDCSIHAWMRAWIVITEHPYAVVTDKNGRFEIAHIPRGTWTFRFWHERPGYVKELTQNRTPLKLKSGNQDIEIDGSVLDLGELTVDASMFSDDR